MRTRARDDADYGDGAHLTVTVNVHVSADTTVEVTTFADQGRATVTFTGYRHASDVALFLRTAELRELRDLLADALTALTDADSPAEPAPVDPTGGGGEGVTDRAA
jgi:hypothetical protein